LADDGADMEKGPGVVMCATFGDSADAEWHAKHKLPYRRAITPDGRIAAEAPYIGGIEIQAARTEIIRLLGERGLMLKSETITHAVGAHERCGRPVEIIPSRQWYIEIMSERDHFLKAADEINWYPPSMKNRYTAWVENLKWDWCISRQRYFGVPFPVWYCTDCGAAAFASEEQLPVNPLETAYAGACAGCGCTRFVPEGAVFDTWATSSVTPQINERLGLKLAPMGMRTHAHDIIRTWTFYTIARSLYHTGGVPWKDLMICGFIMAKKGEKISKSKGEKNDDMDPERLIAAHSADALRYWTAGARLGSDTFFSESELAIPKRFITKLWNAARFAQPHLEGMCANVGAGEGAVAQERGSLLQPFELQSGMLPIDRWIIERAHEACGRAAKLLYEYEIGAARHEIDRFFWDDFCDNYIELVKERLYEPGIHGEQAQNSGRRALYSALLAIIKMYAIYVPHITEQIYQELFRRNETEASIHLTRWPIISAPTSAPTSASTSASISTQTSSPTLAPMTSTSAGADSDLLAFGELLKGALRDARKFKSDRKLSMRAAMGDLEIHAEQRYMEWFAQSEKDIIACTNAKKIIYK
ncbi:MAG: class I tRNA ligase family protein, partial [Oscillospiraceae bacterium]|nr:class I tRNA ligase family protein [Oscillospiraceae bacterium]